ncbi:MAG: carboxymuconolactone decarboxylase family protein [Bradyrhizobium sp.]|jgi:4-carboxymuconolactone decarboxylase|nr:carboxymuconolactone decarboxylase family protein [Bradyrhizobium sp.]
MTSDKGRLDKGLEMFREVYGTQVPVPENAETSPFHSLMIENLFGEIWSREAMSIRDRRLILIGVIAGVGADMMLLEIQLKSALEKGELQREQLREIPILLTQYVGYPKTVPIMFAVEKVLAATADS